MPLLRQILGCLLALGAVPAWADLQLNMTPGVTEVSRQVYNLHMTIFWICVAIGAGVFAVMFYAILRHRKSRGHQAAQFHENLTVELIWTFIPFVILISMAIPATKTLILMDDTERADLTIKVTGHQWKWQYDYLEYDLGFYSNLSTPLAQITNQAPKGAMYLLEVDNPMVVPVGKKIRFLMTSNDVIHSWWVPALAVKKDTIPGFINETWARIDKVGMYYGQCAELCGVNHAYMPIVVDARPESEFLAWVAEKHAEKARAIEEAKHVLTLPQLMSKGEAVYQRVCVACHQANGQGLPGVFPALKGSKIATGAIADHIRVVLHGVKGTAMQPFAGQLDDVELAAVITYERNAWGNNTGDLVQASAIKAAR